ncbi:MAG: DUF484 family protein [Methylococcaceae bacterium]|nr:DUF484 family protein [Methylococcaceae bacterium]
MIKKQVAFAPELTSLQVEHYLRQHPEFFNEHLHLLEQMIIPHPSGNAVSLISKQLEIYRSRHQELETQLTALIDVARENDASSERMHKLALALLDASTLEELLSNLELVLSEFFLTDFSAVRVIQHNPDVTIENLFIEPGCKSLEPFMKEMSSNKPKCGRPTLAQATVLFGKSAFQVKSCAIIPMNFTELEGILAIGSHQEGRFHHSMGHLFLTQMSEIVGTRLISLLHQK